MFWQIKHDTTNVILIMKYGEMELGLVVLKRSEIKVIMAA